MITNISITISLWWFRFVFMLKLKTQLDSIVTHYTSSYCVLKREHSLESSKCSKKNKKTTGDSWQSRHENTGVQTQFSACLFITWVKLTQGSVSSCHWEASVCLSACRADALENVCSRAPGPYFIIVMKERVVKGDAVLLSSDALYSHGSTTPLLPAKTSGKVRLSWPWMTWTVYLVVCILSLANIGCCVLCA